ncbi:predicted protein [Phaeodactylum tricornutum CCAP 1055/1]|uniref:Uncharacterized protein n=1 Tax=Phaeodactylum tricornutum (strain CCAP 1055/1) TaxID=556484 RepID=B7G3G8_PHATC|nr:predicted protein [Phaeodactylum tricornutum CCAP 1055/1]EEC46828.1 predicted protein [Phaeodactylum tricornutum CCAP 1055/1]|eukprot:XP_002181614.1 predicted protein [Phaeodactylum tricornutum CCAP 1055/1]
MTLVTSHPYASDGAVNGEKEIDASVSFLCWLVFLPCTFGAIPFKTTLLLDDEEVTKADVPSPETNLRLTISYSLQSDLCGNHVSRRPYGELGSVDRGTCLCCISVESAFGPISPGCGCDAGKVDEIVHELKTRMRLRGDTAQILRAEETLQRLHDLDAKLVREL